MKLLFISGVLALFIQLVMSLPAISDKCNSYDSKRTDGTCRSVDTNVRWTAWTSGDRLPQTLGVREWTAQLEYPQGWQGDPMNIPSDDGIKPLYVKTNDDGVIYGHFGIEDDDLLPKWDLDYHPLHPRFDPENNDQFVTYKGYLRGVPVDIDNRSKVPHTVQSPLFHLGESVAASTEYQEQDDGSIVGYFHVPVDKARWKDESMTVPDTYHASSHHVPNYHYPVAVDPSAVDDVDWAKINDELASFDAELEQYRDQYGDD